MHKTFKEFYKNFSLEEFPFNTFTTEHESKIAKEIFIYQGEYDPIIDTFRAGRNLIILGERGSGKTAILEDFYRDLLKDEKLTTVIHDYSNLSKKTNSTEIYRLLISNFAIDLFTKLGKNNLKLFKINKEEKILLSYILSQFLQPISQNLLKDKISQVQIPLLTRAFKWIYNKIRGPLNFGGTVAKNITYQYLFKHFSFLPHIEDDNQIQNFFPELRLDVDNSFFTQEITFKLITKIGDISNKLGFKKPVVLFDRLDEDPRFKKTMQRLFQNLLRRS